MKNSLLFLAVIFTAGNSISQTYVKSIGEFTTYDERQFTGSVTTTSKRIVTDTRIQLDGKGIYSFSAGISLLKKKEMLIALLGGVSFSSEQTMPSVELLCKKEQEEKPDFLVVVKGMKGNKEGGDAIFVGEGEILFPLGNFRLGPSIAIETEKYKTHLEGFEVIRWDGMSLIGARANFKPPLWEHVSFTALAGWRNFTPSGKSSFAFISEKALPRENSLAIKAGIQLNF